MNTRAFSLPDVMSSGNYVDLQEGERVIVVAKGGNWFKIIYMNAEYYVLSYLTPREVFIEENPDVEIADNTGYAPAGSADAASSAAAAGGFRRFFGRYSFRLRFCLICKGTSGYDKCQARGSRAFASYMV